jgi:hypothetical protein
VVTASSLTLGALGASVQLSGEVQDAFGNALP